MNPMRNILSTLSLVSVAALATGCGDSVLGDGIEDQIRDVVGDGGYQGQVVQWSAEESDLSIPDYGVRSFGRTFNSPSTTYDVSESGEGARVAITQVAAGTMVIDRDDGSTDVITISHSGARLVDVEGDGSEGWEVDQISAYDGQSDDLLTKIEQVIVSWGEERIAFDDTDEMFETDALAFFPNDEVTITVVVNAEDVLGVLHLLDSEVQVMEQKLLDDTEQLMVLQSSYIAPADPGRYFTYVDIFLLSVFGELGDIGELDDIGDYSAASWGMPYQVNGNSH